VKTRYGRKHCIIFINDCRRYCYIYLLKRNDGVLEIFKHYKNEVENQLNKNTKVSSYLL